MKALKRISILLLVFGLVLQVAGLGNAVPPSAYAAEDLTTEYVEPALTVDEPAPAQPTTNITQLFWHETTGLAPSFSVNTATASAMGLSLGEASDPVLVAQAFLSVSATDLGMDQSASQWNVERMDSDNMGISHVRFNQHYSGLSVFAAELIVHVSGDRVVAVNGQYPASISVSEQPRLDVDEAFNKATQRLGLSQPILQSNELIVFNPSMLNPAADRNNHLSYRLVVEQQNPPDSLTVFVDANTGEVLHRFSNWIDARNREVYDLNGATVLPGTLVYNEAGPIGSPPSDATNAYTFTGNSYDYYSSTFTRDSYDNNGATMKTSVRYGSVANAFWMGTQTVFGPGFAVKDVVAHEWTHAVTQYTANLMYSYQSGALNEAMSDIFGAMVDRDDWLMGEDLSMGAIRNLADPSAFGDPGKVSEYLVTSGDNGGVHTNSLIVGHAAYLMSDGGTYNGRTVTGIGRAQTEQIFYQALTTYLTSGSGFKAAYNAIRSSAADLYGGTGSATYANVTTALQAVELDIPVPGGPPVITDNPTNVTSNSAILNGTLDSLDGAPSANVSFEWGTDPGNFTNQTPVEVMNSFGDFSANLTGLVPDTMYYFRAKAVSANTSYGGVLSFLTFAPDTWQSVRGTSNILSDVTFIDTNNGWAVGGVGLILHTSNGGSTWTAQNSSTINDLWSVSFADSNNGWAVGAGGTIRRTSDGGATWVSQSGNTGNSLYGVSFVDAGNGWAVGSGGVVRRTSNGGATWTNQTSNTTNLLFSVKFVDANNGWAVGSSGVIRHTSDGGLTWTSQNSTTTTNWLNSVTFVDASNGWVAVASTNFTLHTTDGGNTWSRQSVPGTFFTALDFVDVSNGWAVGWLGNIARTTNGGNTWTAQTSNTTAHLTGVAFVSGSQGFAVGEAMTILSTANGGAAWTVQSQALSSSYLLSAVDFVTTLEGWATVAGRPLFKGVWTNGVTALLHTTDGGTTWTWQNVPSSTHRDVDFVDINNGWVVGSGGGIIHTSNGGNTWTSQTSNMTTTLYSVKFLDASNGWAVGGPGAILHTSNGGTTWTPQTSNTAQYLYGVSFVDANNGWAVGYLGTILHTSNGGDTWTNQTSGTSYPLYGLSFVDSNNGWAVGYFGTILHTSNGGSTWTVQSSGTGNTLNGVRFVDANNGWAVGYGGIIIYTTNGGNTWTLQNSGTANILRGVSATDSRHIWTVGDYNIILRYVGTDPPVVTTNNATLITSNSSRLNGTLSSFGALSSANVSFEWGTNSGNLTQQTAPQLMSGETGGFGVTINSLSANTTYYFRARADGDGTGYGSVMSFSTYLTPPPFLLKWGTPGSGDGQFNESYGVAIDASGNVYVGDNRNHRIQKFSSSGRFIMKWGSIGNADGQFNGPRSLAVDASGNLYVADTNNNRIQKFTGSGVFITKWGTGGSADDQFSGPKGIAVDSSGNVYVADDGNNRIQKFTGDGVFLTKWGALGSGDGQFDGLEAVTVDSSGNVYVAGQSNNRIQKFTSSGQFILKWGSNGYGDGQLSAVYGLAPDASGNIYVADTFNDRIQKFTGDGGFLTKWGTGGAGDGQFYYPLQMAVDASGNLYVADQSNNRVQVFGVALPPTVATLAADNITATSATLRGTLNGLGTALSANVSFEWVSTADNLTRPTYHQIMVSAGNFSANLTGFTTGFTSNTSYYFRAKAVGDGTAFGAEMSFTTLPPVLQTIGVTPVNFTIGSGFVQQFTATGAYSDNTTKNLTASVDWTSSNATVAVINSLGSATGNATGNTTITAVSGNISGNTTLTVTTDTGTVDISVILQGGARPPSGWVVPLIIKFFTAGTANITANTTTSIYSFTQNTTKLGSTAVTGVTGISPGTYDITVKSDHTLLNVKRNVAISLPSTAIIMGTLLEGNADQSNSPNIINISDFTTLSDSYGKSLGQDGYNAQADFDRNNTVNIFDFTLLSVNYQKSSPISLP